MFTKKPIPFLFFLLFLWIGLVNFFAKSFPCCGGLADVPSLLIKDGDKTVGSSASNFHFGLGAAAPSGINNVKGAMQDIANYLNTNKDKNLLLTGRFETEEANNTSFDNLGLGRADGLRKHLIELGAPADRLWTESKLVDSLSFTEGKTYDGIDWSWLNLTRSISFIDGDYSNTYADDFAFTNSEFEHIAPIGDGLQTTIGKAAEYLKKSAERNMRITGHYMEGEQYSGALNDLGLGRANNIKKLFTDLGVPSKQLEIASAKKALNFFKNVTTGAVTYDFFGAETDNRLAEVEARLRANPLVLYFDTNKSNLSLTTAQRQYMTDLVYYLDKKDGGNVKAIGHTDNEGSLSNNDQLGKRRAEFVRNYLKRNSINENKVLTSSKGQNEPTATNDTEDGRAKNRRVEIRIN